MVRAGSDQRNLDGLDVERHESDLLDPALAEGMGGAEAVFHVAAHYSLFRSERETLYRVNLGGTEHVLAAARAARVARVVYTSSVSAIGVRHGGVADETFAARLEDAVGDYKRSKFLAERAASLAAERGQDVVIVNPSTPIGPLDRKPTPTGEILVRFMQGRLPVLVETGLNFVDVAAVARGHLFALERGRRGQRYILGGTNLPLRALLEKVAAVVGRAVPRTSIPWWAPLPVAWLDERVFARLGKRPTIPIDGVRMAKESMYYDTSKAMRELGYEPGSLDDAVRAAVTWFADNGYG
jgi:hopanoid-associated sugar epimerase